MDLLIVRTVVSSLPSLPPKADVVAPCTHQHTYMSGAGTMCVHCGIVLTANALKLEQTYQQNQHYFTQYRRITRTKPAKSAGPPSAPSRREDTLTRVLLENLGAAKQPPGPVLHAVRSMFDLITGDEQLHRFLRSDAVSMTTGSRGRALVMVVILKVLRSGSKGSSSESGWLSEIAVVRAFNIQKKFATKALNIVAAWDRRVHLDTLPPP